MPPFSLGQKYTFQKIHEEQKGKVLLLLPSKSGYQKGLPESRKMGILEWGRVVFFLKLYSGTYTSALNQ